MITDTFEARDQKLPVIMKSERLAAEQQVDVAELVPQVTGRQCLGVALVEQFGTGDRRKHVEMRRSRLVEPRDQAVGYAYT